MEQPLLPEVKPYVNRNLFSLHFLDEVLPQDASWQVDEDKLRLSMLAIENLLSTHGDVLPQLDEAKLERRFARPAFEALGHCFEVHPKLPTPEGLRWPDYALFASKQDQMDALREHEGEPEYFTKAIAIADAKRWGRPLDKRQRGGTDKFDMLSPSWQIDYYLRISEVPWGILTDGRFWRLYNRDTSFRLDVYYEIDLPQLIAQRDTEAFKYFYLFFRREAFIGDAEGLCFLDRVYQGSLEYARAVGDDLKENVYKALRVLAEGFLNSPGNDLDQQFDLEAIHENSLVYLYRLLFINYAEDRGLLPRDNRLYKETYGLVSMEREIASKMERQQSLSPLQATYWERLRALFDLVNGGSEAFRIDKDTLFVPPYNGGLFEPERHGFLEKNKVADRWLAQVIDFLARSKGEGAGRAFVDYTSLDVRHLGSIYEGLLEYKLSAAAEDMVAVKRRGREEWVPAGEAGGKKVVETVERGGLYLATDRGERKATGSYYTPDYIVKYIVENTVGPLIEEKMKEDDAIDGILSLKVLDPAMGSGHFLVEAIDRLAHALVEALGGSEEEPEEADVRWARREVVERCLYGVDLNPLAVELAKLSLWLHTVAEGKPLNFLDHHLKVGNSLIGAWVDDLGSLPAAAKKAKGKDAEIDARQMNLFEIRFNERLPVMLGKVLEIIGRGSETLDDIEAKAAADEAIEELKAPFKAVANSWVSTYFGNEVTAPEYQEALEHIGETRQLLALGSVGRAREIAIDRHFFHWELEFPEVFYDDSTKREKPGFDVVIGNPPYFSIAKLPGPVRDYLGSQYKQIYAGNSDILYYFLSLARRLPRETGVLAYIVARYFQEARYAKPLRRYLGKYTRLLRFVDFQNFQAFGQEVNVLASVVILTPNTREHRATALRIIDDALPEAVVAKALETEDPGVFEISNRSVMTEDGSPWFFVGRAEALDAKIEGMSIVLRDIATVVQSMQTGRNEVLCPTSQTVAQYELEDELLHPLAKAGSVLRFEFRTLDARVLWTEGINLEEYPNTLRYLSQYRDDLACRYDIQARSARWWEISNPRNADLFFSSHPRILVPFMATGNRFCVDDINRFNDGGDLRAVFFDKDTEYSEYFVCAVLNSKVLDGYHKRHTKLKRGGYYEYFEGQVSKLPIPRVNFTTPADQRAESGRKGRELHQRSLSEGHGEVLGFVQLHIERGETDVVHDVLAYLAEQMIGMNREKQAEAKGFLEWLAGYTHLPIEEWRLKTILKAYWEHGWDELQRALGQNRKPIEKASGRNVEGREAVEAIETEFEKSVACLEPLMERIASTDRLIDLIVYRLYGLTDQEVAIVEESATR